MGAEIFQDIMVKTPNSNKFDLSHNHKTTLKMGTLVPVLCKEALPGDNWSIRTANMTRFLPLVAPIMHNVEVFFHTFFVPNRILWKPFENLIRGPRTNTDDEIPAMPVLHASEDSQIDCSNGTLAQYLGLPQKFTDVFPFEVSALPFAAYQRIWWDYYRDQNLQFPTEEFPELLEGEQTPALCEYLQTLRSRAWEHDYFTSGLPWAQKGEPVPIPVIGEGTVILNDVELPGSFISPNGSNVIAGDIIIDGAGNTYSDAGGNSNAVKYDPNGTLQAIITNIATTIKDLRTAEALQRFLETNARAGNRYFEYLKAIWGVSSPDSRLQRAEYIGGSKSRMTISEVLQTSESTNDSPLGDMAGHAVSVGQGDVSTYYCQEHGYIITLMSVRPRTSYFQGLERHWRRFDRFDFPIPEFAHIGEQEVKMYELFAWYNGIQIPTPETLESTFAYLPRYSEFKSAHNRVSGAFVDTDTVGLSSWHLARYFENLPALNEDFVVCNPNVDNILPVSQAVYDGDYILTDIWFDIWVTRKLPRFDIPQLGG